MSAEVITVVELGDWSLGVGTVVGLTTTELLGAWLVGRADGGGAITEIAGNCTVGAGASCARLGSDASARLVAIVSGRRK